MSNTPIFSFPAATSLFDNDAIYLSAAPHGIGADRHVLISTIREEIVDVTAASLVGGTNISVTYNDPAGTITIAYTGAPPPASTTDLPEGTNLYFTTERAQDAVGAAFDVTLVYDDPSNTMGRAAITGAVTIPAGSNTASLGSFTKAQLNAAVSDGDPLYVGDVLGITSVNAPITFSGGALGFDDTANLDNVARTTVRLNSGSNVGSRRRLNFIEGTGITLTVADDSANEEVDITIGAVGGSGTPGGSDRQVQFNNAGSFGGASITVPSSEPEVFNLPPRSSSVGAPSSGNLKLFSQSFGDRSEAFARPAHCTLALPLRADGIVRLPVVGRAMTQSNTNAGPVSDNLNISSVAASVSYVFTPGGDRWQGRPHKRWTSATTAGSTTGVRTNYNYGIFSSNTSGRGGWYILYEVGHQTNTAGYQLFAGVCALTGTLNGDPSALLNMVGIGYDAGDAATGNWFLMHNDGSGTATKIDLGATQAARANNQGFRVELFNPQGSLNVHYNIFNVLNNASVANGVLTTDTPAAGVGLCFKAEARNGALTTAATLEFHSMYTEGYDFV